MSRVVDYITIYVSQGRWCLEAPQNGWHWMAPLEIL